MRGLGKIYTIDELREIIVPVLKQHDVECATLFGSYAKGNPTECSDVDLLIRTDKRGFEFGEILADLFDCFGYGNVDLYAEYELDSTSGLMLEIRKTGVILYERKP